MEREQNTSDVETGRSKIEQDEFNSIRESNQQSHQSGNSVNFNNRAIGTVVALMLRD